MEDPLLYRAGTSGLRLILDNVPASFPTLSTPTGLVKFAREADGFDTFFTDFFSWKGAGWVSLSLPASLFHGDTLLAGGAV